MPLPTLVRQPSMAEQVLRILIQRINQGDYPPGSQFPTENELAEEMGVSRATIRHACSLLEERGLLQRRQGVGSFVSRALSIANPLFQYTNFEERIASRGLLPAFQQLEERQVDTSPEIAARLDLQPGAPALQIHKIWTADGQPIVYIINHIPTWAFEACYTPEEVLQPGFTEPFFQFFRTRCGRSVSHLASVISPTLAQNCALPPCFAGLDPLTPLLLVEDVGFSDDGRPVFHSLEHLVGIASRFETMRRVL